MTSFIFAESLKSSNIIHYCPWLTVVFCVTSYSIQLVKNIASIDLHANQPRHDKTNTMSVRPAKTQISLGICPVWSESSLSTWRKLGSLATHWVQSEDSDQADLRLRWAHTHFVGFVVLWLKLFTSKLVICILKKTIKLWSDCSLHNCIL